MLANLISDDFYHLKLFINVIFPSMVYNIRLSIAIVNRYN